MKPLNLGHLYSEVASERKQPLYNGQMHNVFGMSNKGQCRPTLTSERGTNSLQRMFKPHSEPTSLQRAVSQCVFHYEATND
jgi:hypothetical protein